MDIIKNLEKLGKPFWIVMGFILLCGVGTIDYITGPELSFSLFYLLPITLITWFVGVSFGIMTAVASAGIWLVADILSGMVYSSPVIYFWNTTIRFGFFILVVLFLRLGEMLEHEKIFSHTDYVTGAWNSRFFYTLAQREIDYSLRYHRPFTIVYIDIDNFKSINDVFGHITGDKVLSVVAKTLQKELRKTDIVARVGGDEFTVLLPEIGPETVQRIISKMHRKLLDKMRKNNWLVTFSIGVLTFLDSPHSVDEMLDEVDKAMYSVKTGGKNNIKYTTHGEKII